MMIRTLETSYDCPKSTSNGPPKRTPKKNLSQKLGLGGHSESWGQDPPILCGCALERD
jgi:hypothetical protein